MLHKQKSFTSLREAYVSVFHQSHASDTVVTVNHKDDLCAVRQAQQLELNQRTTLRHVARSPYYV